MSQSSIPDDQDLTSGEQILLPEEGTILGAIEGFQQRIITATPEQRSQFLPSALQYGEAGIDVLISILNDDSVLTVRATAYQQLQRAITESSESNLKQKLESAIAQGIPLKQGDILYGVYEIPIEYDDENHIIYGFSSPKDTSTSGDYLDVVEKVYPNDDIDWDTMDPAEIDEIMEEWGASILLSRHVFRASAEEIAEHLNRERILDATTPDLFEFAWFRDRGFDVNQWCIAHGWPPLPEEEWWSTGPELVQQLKDRQEVALLCQLWKETVGHLVEVHEQVINRNCYLQVTRSL